MEWTKQRPDYACAFVTRDLRSGYYDYALWQFVWERGEAPENAVRDKDASADAEEWFYYLAWTDNDGNEWDSIEECNYDEYLVIGNLPTMKEVHEREVEELRERYEKMYPATTMQTDAP